jgi:hypothetical protein
MTRSHQKFDLRSKLNLRVQLEGLNLRVQLEGLNLRVQLEGLSINKKYSIDKCFTAKGAIFKCFSSLCVRWFRWFTV